MNTYLINLDRDKERFIAADLQLRRLGIGYERVSAVCGKTLPCEVRLKSVDKLRWWCAIGRPVRLGEIGCAMSHYSIYRQIAEPVCILEDDVILDPRFPSILAFVEKWINPARPQVVLLSNHTKESKPSQGVFPAKSDMYTEGYVITPVAAKALLNVNWPLQRPCDHWGVWTKRRIIELYHAFPTVCSQDQSQYESSTAGVGIFNVAELGPVALAIHKCKRVVGKVIDKVLPL